MQWAFLADVHGNLEALRAVLRDLEDSAPYFHNGSAARLEDVVNFYDLRFGIGLSNQQKNDLVNFLKTL